LNLVCKEPFFQFIMQVRPYILESGLVFIFVLLDNCTLEQYAFDSQNLELMEQRSFPTIGSPANRPFFMETVPGYNFSVFSHTHNYHRYFVLAGLRGSLLIVDLAQSTPGHQIPFNGVTTSIQLLDNGHGKFVVQSTISEDLSSAVLHVYEISGDKSTAATAKLPSGLNV